MLARQIEIDRKRIELKAIRERDLAMAEADAAAAAAKAKADADAKFLVEEAKLEAEEKYIALSERGSSVTSSRRGKCSLVSRCRNTETPKLSEVMWRNSERDARKSLDGNFVSSRTNRTSCGTRFEETKPKVVLPSQTAFPVSGASLQHAKLDTNSADNTKVFEAYLERQGRNEFINLAAQIGYDGNNIAYVFYENQIRKLMAESPCDERKLEILRASCLGQPREMVNLFIAPMRCLSTPQRIEKALDRLRQRYGVSGGLTSEPQIISIRHGPKVVFTSASLKSFNEDLNTLEVFAYAHDEAEKLSGQLLLDVANRLPGVLKRRYLDYLSHRGLSLNKPGFESLRRFVVHELGVITSDYAQTFFKSEDKEKTRETNGGRNSVRVRQVAFESNETEALCTIKNGPVSRDGTLRNQRSYNAKPPPFCFVCNDSVSKHFLGDCDKFKSMTDERKRRAVIEAGRCLNCLSLGHVVKNCPLPSKCRRCGPKSGSKHAGALHESYAQSRCVDVGAAGVENSGSSNVLDNDNINTERNQPVVRKLTPNNNNVLLRTSAVRVINPCSGKSVLAYAQHDTASQATLISERLKNELDLNVDTKSTVTIRTLADQTTKSGGLAEFILQSLTTNEKFEIKKALVVPEFTDDERTLPHAVNVKNLDHFKGVEIPVITERKSVDILIGQTDKLLLTVLEERESINPDDPNYVLTRLGPIASGGLIGVGSKPCQTLKVQTTSECCDECECDQLKQEISELKDSLRNYQMDDEVIQPSVNDDIARQLVESNVRVKNGRYEIPVPLKTNMLKSLPNNYSNALNRTKSLRQKALKNDELKRMLVDTFCEMINEGWIVPVDGEDLSDNGCWYLPFFVTKQDKPRVVFDGAAKFQGSALNDAVLSGVNLLNNLVDVLTRFRVGKYACMADLSKCFFQVSLPENQRDLFRLVWFRNSDIDSGYIQLFQFTRHVWGINSSPYIALFAIQRLISENPTDAGELTLTAIENNRYMDDLLLSSDSLVDLHTVSRESIALFKSRGFKLRKWVANNISKSVLSEVPKDDLSPNLKEIDIGTQLMQASKALGLVWDVENDRLRVSCKQNLTGITTRREMLSALASQFDPLGILAPCLLGGKSILQRVTALGLEWDDSLPSNILEEWHKWVEMMDGFVKISIPRYCFHGGDIQGTDRDTFQLHGFCDASDHALSCVMYLRRVVSGRSCVAFIQGKTRVVLINQTNWVISRKELEAAKMCAELMQTVSKSLRHLACSLHFWSDSQVVLKWIINPDLHLPRFVKRRVDKINFVAPASAWSYINTSLNPADVGTRIDRVKKSGGHLHWLAGPDFLWQGSLKPAPSLPEVVINKTNVDEEPLLKFLKTGLDCLIEISPDLYTLKKRTAYLIAFKKFLVAKHKRKEFIKPLLNAAKLEEALLDLIKYVQHKRFGTAVELLKVNSADAFDSIIKKLSDKVSNTEDMRRISELRTLRNLRPCVDDDSMLRVDGRLENAELPVETKHPLILPSKHPLTRLIVLHEHEKAKHGGPSYTLMKTRQRYWIIYGISSVKGILSECSKCLRRKATPIRQLMADLPACRVTATNKPFKICGVDYCGPFTFRQNRSVCKAWGLLFTCLCTRCIHVELVTGLDLDNFLLAFSRFTNLRGAVDTFMSDNGSTFSAAADRLPSLLDSTGFKNSLRKRGINWVKIPPYAPSQGGSWEIMVKLFKNALGRVLQDVRRRPSLIELQTFVSDAVRIVNDRPLTTVSSHPNDLAPISPSSFLGQLLAPNTPLSAFHDQGDLRRDYQFNVHLAHKFWISWMKGYLPTLQGRAKWRIARQNISPGQLVLVGDANDIARRGHYRLGRIHEVHPQIRKGREIVRRATVAVLKHSGSGELEYVLRDLSKIAPL